MTLEILDDAVTHGDSLRHCRGIFLSDNERQLAKDKWDMLQERLQLKSVHHCVIEALKVTRNITTHYDMLLIAILFTLVIPYVEN